MSKRKWLDEQMIHAVQTSKTMAEVIRTLGLKVRPGNYTTLRKYIKLLKLDTSHFTGQAHGKTIPKTKRTNEQVFIAHSDYSRSDLKQRILNQNLLPYRCDLCNLDQWQNQPIILVLDHINGISNDHRIENLRLLCPNCNSQQPTFCRKTSL
jgi:hypothetical protein